MAEADVVNVVVKEGKERGKRRRKEERRVEEEAGEEEVGEEEKLRRKSSLMLRRYPLEVSVHFRRHCFHFVFLMPLRNYI